MKYIVTTFLRYDSEIRTLDQGKKRERKGCSIADLSSGDNPPSLLFK